MMNELFLQELNAITAYANSSNTNYTTSIVKEMLKKLLEMNYDDLLGSRTDKPDWRK